MKRFLSLALCAALAIAALTACAPQPEAEREPAGRVEADNEILTYTRIDPDRTTLIVSFTGNTSIAALAEAFEEKNPDVQVVCIDITGGNTTVRPVADCVTHAQAPDIMIVPTNILPEEVIKNYFEDLSGRPLVSAYESEALNSLALDARIYALPGPSRIDCMFYNKTLFERYGWELPRTFDEFVALCLRIREDTNGEVQPWNPNAKYSAEFTKVTEAFAYEEIFGGVENRAWYNEFCDGKASFAGHMEPYYDMLQTLIDNGLLVEEHFSYSATTRGKEFEAGKIAMYNYIVMQIGNDEGAFEFDFMPFPTTKGENGYVCNSINNFLGVPIKEHTEAEKDAIDRFLAFFSSPEGQQAYIGDSLMVSSVKGVVTKHADKIAALEPTIEQGRLFTEVNFKGAVVKKGLSLHDDALAMVKGEKTAAECIAAVDAAPFIPAEEAKTELPEAIATANERFTSLETSCFIADMYRERAGADIGLINHGVAYRGNLMRIFAGDLTEAHVNTLLPRSLANDSKLVKVSMSGQQILDALNHPVGNEGVTDSLYAFSGLRCSVAPWNPLGEKYLSVTLADGAPLEMEKLYTVAIWEGTVDEAYITETLESFEGTWEAHMLAKLRAAGTISPAKDGRITLVWE